LHFTGVAISDWQDVQMLQTRYHIVSDYEHAIAVAVNAGIDVTMEPYNADAFVSNLKAAVADGLVSRARIRQAAERVLALKFRTGLFDHPYVDASNANSILQANLRLARRAAAESSVLVKNDNSALPLSPSQRVVVTGPAADSIADTLGGWSVGWQGVPPGSPEKAVTVRQGMESAGGANVTYAPDQATAVADAASADAIVAVLGRGPGAEGPNDQRDPTLPADQQAMVTALKATGKPVIVVLIDDRPDALGSALNADAILMAWRPGTEGGNGVADLLYGKVNPSGRLPVTWPKRATDQPDSYLYQTLPTTYNGNGPVYDPQYPFGWGLSYSTTSLSVTHVAASAGTISVRVSASNTGGPAGTVIVPVYVSQPVSRVLVPAKRLVGFTRVSLQSGQTRTVTVRFPRAVLGVVPGDIDANGPLVVEHGQYVFSTGTVSDTATANSSNTLNL
jgi:beta-glucosidase